MARSRRIAKKPVRRSPISRQEGERRLIAAATALLQSKPFPTVSVRDLATEANVHQSYIHTWFGSQSGLYVRVLAEACTRMVNSLRDRTPNVMPIDPNDPFARFAVRLLFWLDLEGADLSELRPVLDQLARAHAQRLSDLVGLDSKTATGLAPQGLITFLGLSAFGHLLGTNPNEIHRILMTWLKQGASRVDPSSHQN